ncbi:hypothetical protein TWF481_003093 [Arthrobotrys musiformis]|uniref:F-box domain-containing protein n=1 Tax=Arthrobotrys musiformis TaxID=47236 RepID=A0AAV9VRT5_9PEZI
MDRNATDIPQREGEKQQERARPTILDILNANLEPIYGEILSYLDLPDMLRLFATCKTIHNITYCLYDIDAQLRQFFPKDPTVFRQAMADNNLIVSGSVALKFFTRDKWPTKDLDVYTDSRASLKRTGDILKAQGYIFTPFAWHSKSIEASLANSVSSFQKRSMERFSEFPERQATLEEAYFSQAVQIQDVFRFENRARDLHIDIILTLGPSLQAILQGYYSTYIMNFFTYNRAYSLFPHHTVLQREGFRTVPDTPEKRAEAIEKYKNRGFKYLDYGRYHTCKMQCPLRPHRRVGDIFTWTIDLPINGIRLPTNPLPVENYTFRITAHESFLHTYSRAFNALPNIRIEANQYAHKGLEHLLLVDPAAVSPENSWHSFLTWMLNLVEKQQAKLDLKVADPWLQRDRIINADEKYADKEVAGYYKFWYHNIMPRENIWAGQYPTLQ